MNVLSVRFCRQILFVVLALGLVFNLTGANGSNMNARSGPLDGPNPPPGSESLSMPLLGHDGHGRGGYCVSTEGSSLIVNVPGHILDPLVRAEENRKNTGFQFSLDPGVIVREYRDSVQNAFKVAANFSGNPALIAASKVPLVFPALGDVQPDASSSTSECMHSSCYGKGQGCQVSGCFPGCADCIYIRVKTIK